MKLKWSVSPSPTGQWRAFSKRGWPSAVYQDSGKLAIMLRCQDEYVPRKVKTGDHAEIVIYVADYSKQVNGGFMWRKLVRRASTLAEAKTIAQQAVDILTEIHPK